MVAFGCQCNCLINRVVRFDSGDQVHRAGELALKALTGVVVNELDENANAINLLNDALAPDQIAWVRSVIDPDLLTTTKRVDSRLTTMLDRSLDLVELSIVSTGIDELSDGELIHNEDENRGLLNERQAPFSLEARIFVFAVRTEAETRATIDTLTFAHPLPITVLDRGATLGVHLDRRFDIVGELVLSRAILHAPLGDLPIGITHFNGALINDTNEGDRIAIGPAAGATTSADGKEMILFELDRLVIHNENRVRSNPEPCNTILSQCSTLWRYRATGIQSLQSQSHQSIPIDLLWLRFSAFESACESR